MRPRDKILLLTALTLLSSSALLTGVSFHQNQFLAAMFALTAMGLVTVGSLRRHGGGRFRKSDAIATWQQLIGFLVLGALAFGILMRSMQSLVR